ncbi:MAG: phosphoadenylyl-sulfate reductase [Planctomycetota bacterium]
MHDYVPAALPAIPPDGDKTDVTSNPSDDSSASSAQLPHSAASHAATSDWTLTPELRQELDARSAEFETASPQAILAWAVERFGAGFTMATAFGPEGMVLIHMLAEIAPQTHIFNLDTGYQFRETLELRDRVRVRYGIEVELRRHSLSVEQYEAQHGGPVYLKNPDQCCADRKLSVLTQAVIGKRAWASAIRRDQSHDRSRAAIVGWDKKFNLVKVSPLANWTKKDVWNLITKHDIPYNPLHDQGYPSIGCWPCTRAVLFGEDERAGRWSGFQKTECGLHSSSDSEPGSPTTSALDPRI